MISPGMESVKRMQSGENVWVVRLFCTILEGSNGLRKGMETLRAKNEDVACKEWRRCVQRLYGGGAGWKLIPFYRRTTINNFH
jgi:hypothetical protein